MKKLTRHQVADIRPSQLLLTYGVGAIVDMPHISALVMGLDSWNTSQASEIIEERLLAAVQSVMGKQVKHLYAPPAEQSANTTTSVIGVPVVAFPRWMVCPACRLLAPIDSGLFTLRTQPFRPDRTCYVHHNCPRNPHIPALPSRFMIACEHGHLDDFPWEHFVHRGQACRSDLRMQEQGVSGEPSAVVISCTQCPARHAMSEAFSSEEEQNYRPQCTGRSPHLRTYASTPCPVGHARTTLLSASNTWFPLSYTLLALPTTSDPLGQLIEAQWETLREAASVEEVTVYRKLAKLRQVFGDYSDTDIWRGIERQRSAPAVQQVKPGDLKFPEWSVLSNPAHAPRTNDFQITPASVPQEYDHAFARVVLVERLREVQALTGFTRIESLSDYAEEEKLPQDHIMPLANKGPYWLPAAEVRGEGIFLQFHEDAIQDWLQHRVVQQHNALFFDAHRRWRQARRLADPEANYPELRYVLLHTFAHALMRQLALECGYAAASIRERIYAQSPTHTGGPMAGILLYTAASDSEGTLGGLVSLGTDLGYHIAGAIEAMEYCASDPLCAEHVTLENNTLHGASCHACLFAPETSCERGNRYLDRSVLISTIEREDLAFFTQVVG